MGFFRNVGLEKVGQRKKKRYKKGVKSGENTWKFCALNVLAFRQRHRDLG